MEAGPLFNNNLRTGAIIQARMKSSRLPGKIMLPLPFGEGEPLLGHIIKRLKKIPEINKIILATSTDRENDVLETITKKYDIDFFRGDEDNVLSRFNYAGRKWNLDNIIRITADNPCIDFNIIRDLLIKHINGNFDISFTSGLPVGMNIEIFTSQSLYLSFKEAKDQDDLEHVTPYMYKNQHITKQKVDYSDGGDFGKIRMTVDYPTDYALMTLIFSYLHNKNNYFGLFEIRELFEQYPWLKEVNGNNYQKKIYKDLDEELEAAIFELEKFEFMGTIDFLRKKINK